MVISDAGPLMRFGRIDAIGVFHKMYGTITIVPEVKVEIMQGAHHSPPRPAQPTWPHASRTPT